MSASYEQRKELEKLMGRDSLVRIPASRSHEYQGNRPLNPAILEDPRICKSYLVGKCPYEMFVGTKENFGRCPRIHKERYRRIYEDAKRRGVDMPGENFEIDYMRELQEFLKDCDHRIQQTKRRLEYTTEEKESLSNISKQIKECEQRMAITIQEVNALNGKGEIGKAIQVSSRLQRYTLDRNDLKREYSEELESLHQASQQKLQICEQCGGLLSKLDNDKRLVAHFTGKIHLAYVEIRTALKELQAKYS